MRRRVASPFFVVGALGALGAGLAGACSATTNNNGFGGGGHGVGAGPNNGGDVGFLDSGAGGSSSGDPQACAADPHVAKQVPLDMYIMLDQSSSMDSAGKWDAITSAIKIFSAQPGLTDIAIGLQYFPSAKPGIDCKEFCASDADCGSYPNCFLGICINCPTESCDPVVYATPAVEITPLPAAKNLLFDSILAHKPYGNTPTAPALQGAIQHATEWLGKNPGHAVVAVLATDGEPTTCEPYDTSTLTTIAAQGLAAGVKTFGIGVFDTSSGPVLLNAITTAGGTGQAFNLSSSQDVQGDFLKALNVIRGTALGCTYSIPVPTTGEPDFTKVNVRYTPGGGGKAVVFPHYQDKASCPTTGDGWYYDDPTAPKQINLCPKTCDEVSADLQGSIEVLLGCKTEEPK
jgi:hypothetical protein